MLYLHILISRRLSFFSGTSFSHPVENICTFQHLIEYGGRTIAALCLHYFWELWPRGDLGYFFCLFSSVSAHTWMSCSRAWKRSRRELYSLNAVLRKAALPSAAVSKFAVYAGGIPADLRCRSLRVFSFQLLAPHNISSHCLYFHIIQR